MEATILNRLSLLLLICLAGSFAWGAAPTITTITPPSAIVGAVITITGTDLDKVTSVTFNGIAAKTITDNTATALKVIVPEGATSGKLVVTTAGGTVTNSYDFIVLFGLKTNAKDNAEMVWVPGGTFTMGSADGVGEKNEHPAHQVTLSGYWIYKDVVTVAQYRAFSNATGYPLPKLPPGIDWKDKTGWDDPTLQQHPIVFVFWNDAKAYADWAGAKLPTEAQWEYAARGPQGRNFPWGNTASKDYLWNGWDATKRNNWESPVYDVKSTWPVGSFHASASWCGAQDMAINVSQWCSDWSDKYPATAVINPTGPALGINRVYRGSSWETGINDRSAARRFGSPSSFNYFLGFRCVSLAQNITTITPPSAVVGAVITITGTDLDKVTEVTFNGIAAKTITDNTATALKVTVPEGAKSGKLTVTTASGTVTNSYDFIVLSGLKINAIDTAEMIWVPGGTFTMGSAAGVGGDTERPAHQVTLSGYWIYRYDVTVAQYRAFCAATNHKMPPFPQPKAQFPSEKFASDFSWAGKTGWDDPELQQHPIVYVSWNDAKAYADWAGVKLPTEAQWEYAARGPQGNNYPWGGTATKDDRNNGWDETRCANYYNSYKVGKSTWPVGSFPAGTSWCGAQDMAGNVIQWCGDWHGDYSAAAVSDPTGPDTGKYRALRGGSWGGDVSFYMDYRSTDRYSYLDPRFILSNIGFRCAIIAPGP